MPTFTSEENIHNARIADAPLQPAAHLLQLIELHQESAQFAAFDRLNGVARSELDSQIFGRAAQNLARELFVVFDVLLALALLDAIERRLRDEDVAAS